MSPEEAADYAEKMNQYSIEVMRMAALMRMAQDAHKSGDLAKAEMYAFAVTTALGLKSQEELVLLTASALSTISTLATQVSDELGKNLVTEVEKMLREKKS